MKKLSILCLILFSCGNIFISSKENVYGKTVLLIKKDDFEDRVEYSYSPPSRIQEDPSQEYRNALELLIPISARIYRYGENPKDSSYKNTSWLVVQLEYRGEDWLFVKKAHFLLDGYRTTVIFNVTDTEVHEGSVSEYEARLYRNDLAQEWAQLLVKIGQSQNAQMQFDGKASTKTYTVSAEQKKAYKAIGEAWLKYFAQ